MVFQESLVRDAVEQLDEDDSLSDYVDEKTSLDEDDVEVLYEGLTDEDVVRRRAAGVLFARHADQIVTMAKLSGESAYVRGAVFGELLDVDDEVCRAAGCVGLECCARVEKESVIGDVGAGEVEEYADDVFVLLEDDVELVRCRAASAVPYLQDSVEVGRYDGALAAVFDDVDDSEVRDAVTDVVVEVVEAGDGFGLEETVGRFVDSACAGEVDRRDGVVEALRMVICEFGVDAVGADAARVSEAFHEVLTEDELELFEAGVAVGMDR